MVSDEVEPLSPRNIIILCDGTGKDGKRDSERGAPVTNIWKLYNAIRKSKTTADVVRYFPGVGADQNKTGASNMLAQMFGYTAVSSINQIYMTIAAEYRPGDNISLFGYSRGAFIVRKVASLVNALGLVRNEDDFNKYWRGLEHKLPGKRAVTLPCDPTPVPISCIGVWDTVGAVRPAGLRETLDLLTLPDDELPEIVQLALHAIAYHENRKLFDVKLFNNKQNRKGCSQMCFPGAHADVGGGGTIKRGLEETIPDITLGWILSNMPSTIRYQLKRTLESIVPVPFRLNDAYHDSPLWKRIPDKLVQRRYLKNNPNYLVNHHTLSLVSAPQSRFLLDWDMSDNAGTSRPSKGKGKRNRRPAQGYPLSGSSQSINVLSTVLTGIEFPNMLPLPMFPTAESQPAALSSLVHTIRQDSTSTQRTNSTTCTPRTISTPRTSIMSADIPVQLNPDRLSTICDELLDFSESPAPSTPIPAPILSPQRLFEQGSLMTEEPDSKSKAPQPVTRSQISFPRGGSKRGVMKKVTGFFRKAFCFGMSSHMDT